MAKKDSSDELANRLTRRYDQLLRYRDGWRQIWTLLCKYVLQRPTWFGDTGVPWRTPRLSVNNVADDTATDSAHTSATAIGGALWPNTAESFELVARTPASTYEDLNDVFKSQEVLDYAERVTHIVRSVIDSPESGFQIAWAEYLDDQSVFGTSGIYVYEDEESDEVPLHFRSIGVETAVIDEGPHGMVDTVYFEYAYTALQVVEKYGLENVSDRTRGLFNSEKYDDYVKVVQAVEPRKKGVKGDVVTNKPYASIHFEYDTKHILKNSGTDQMPVFVTRFRKRPTEVYGRSLAMDALPSIKELNVLRRAFSLALEKMLDPPTGYYPDQIGGSGQVNISAGAKVPLNATGRIPQGQLPIMQLLHINEPQQANQRLQELVLLISQKFLVDRLLDFNNKTRMTMGEAQMRNDFRNQALGNIFSRQIIELLNPMIKYGVATLWRRKMLGLHPIKDALKIERLKLMGVNPLIMPQVIAEQADQGREPFTIRFISPAARAMRADSLVGLEKLTNYVVTWTNAGQTQAADVMDIDNSVREYRQLVGAPSGAVRGVDATMKARKTKQQMQAQQAGLVAQEASANIGAKQAKAAKDNVSAGLPPGGMQQMQQMQGGGNAQS